jgi:hypothetical protein
MQLPSKDGIRCDGCGMIFRDDFTYHSIDFKSAKTKYGQHLSLSELQYADIVGSYDYCSICTEKIFDQIVKINGSASGRKTGLRYCDFTNSDLMQGSQLYYYASITQVNVKLAGKPYLCEKCGSITQSPTTICKCGHNKFEKKADINTISRQVELFLVEDVLKQFSNRKDNIKKDGGNWDVTS